MKVQMQGLQHFRATSGALCEFQLETKQVALADRREIRTGVIATWNREATAKDFQEFEEFIGGMLAPNEMISADLGVGGAEIRARQIEATRNFLKDGDPKVEAKKC